MLHSAAVSWFNSKSYRLQLAAPEKPICAGVTWQVSQHLWRACRALQTLDQVPI